MNQILLALVNSDIITLAPSLKRLADMITRGDASIYVGAGKDGGALCIITFPLAMDVSAYGTNVVDAVRNAIVTAQEGPLK